MLLKWEKDGKKGEIVYPKGEVVYQTEGVKIEPIYVDYDGNYYIEENGKLLKVLMNPYNGYCYRQDGK